MQVDPIQSKLKPPGIKRVKLNCDILLSNSAFKFNLRRYDKERVRWKCGKDGCGHTWHTTPNSRSKPGGSGCPACSGYMLTATNNLQVWCGKNGREDLLAEWAHPDKAPRDFFPASNEKVPWECGKCGRAWEAGAYTRPLSAQPEQYLTRNTPFKPPTPPKHPENNP